MIIRYISAGDRLNYGDMLFSLIFREYFQDEFQIYYYGIVKSNYTDFGAIPTHSYKSLIKDICPSEDIVVIGGGEVLFPRWNKLYSFIYPMYSIIKNNRYLNVLDKAFNLSNNFFYKSSYEFPFVPNLQCENIYISVGGQFNSDISTEEREYLVKILMQSKVVSVRDIRTSISLKSHGLDTDLVPDSAILMSKVYPYHQLQYKLKNKTLLDLNDDYLFLQVGRFKGPKDINKFIYDINYIAKKKGLVVVCCPIGIAPGHEDHELLQYFCKLDSSWKFIKPNNIFDIMYLIAKSDMYIGTSLHGLITAFSYNKPAISLNKKIQKANSFIETWCSEFYVSTIDYEELSSKVILIEQKWNKSKAQVQLEYCQDKVEKYFQFINNYLKTKNNFH
jgi:polysaccharide pyruvyl transferase WcaK-like protein